jgi:alpha-tubulin suppressor-like RCC1 family protein
VKLFTWGWNQRGTLGHPAETKTENIPSQVNALSHVHIVQVLFYFIILLMLLFSLVLYEDLITGK